MNQYQTFMKNNLYWREKKLMGSHFKTQHTRINQFENNTITQNLQDRKQNSTYISFKIFHN